MEIRKIGIIAAVVLWLAFSLSGCALFSVTPPEEALQERVSLYMQARVDDRWNDVYDFFDSGYKGDVSREQFMAMGGSMNFLAFAVESIEVSPSEKEATVMLKVDVEVKGFTFKGTPEKQTWVKEGRQWYIKVAAKTKTPFE